MGRLDRDGPGFEGTLRGCSARPLASVSAPTPPLTLGQMGRTSEMTRLAFSGLEINNIRRMSNERNRDTREGSSLFRPLAPPVTLFSLELQEA